MFNSPFIIPVVAIIAWAVIRIVRIRHGLADEEWSMDGKQRRNPPMFNKMM
jgi:hypothetical protein